MLAIDYTASGKMCILFCIVTAGMCLAIGLQIRLLVRKRRTEKQVQKTYTEYVNNYGTSQYAPSGLLLVYILKYSAGKDDMFPATVNLFIWGSREPFSFAWIKDKCHIDIFLRDADKIWFRGGPEHTLCVKSRGDVAAVCGKKLLLYNVDYLLHYNDKLLLIFNDGEIRLEVHYKEVGYSERERG